MTLMDPARFRRVLRRYGTLPLRSAQATRYARRFRSNRAIQKPTNDRAGNPIEAYFDAHTEGPGIWKWQHYFEIYHRHFARFVGRPVHVMEIGVYSGGSLGMWQRYFGPRARVHGVDIDPACKQYERDGVRIHIGDQADKNFWTTFCHDVPDLDIVIDDGGHEPYQQITTLNALLPHLRPGGVYVCEDIARRNNPFHHYASGLARALSVAAGRPTGFQRYIESVTFYPYAIVITRRTAPLDELNARRRGTDWRPLHSGEPRDRPDACV